MHFKRFFFLIIFIVVNTAVYSQSFENTELTGFVSGEDNLPLSGAEIRLANTNLQAQTNSSGKFAFQNVTAGKYKLTVSVEGYELQEKEIIIEQNRKKLLLS